MKSLMKKIILGSSALMLLMGAAGSNPTRPTVRYTLQLLNASGSPVTTLSRNQSFKVAISVQDTSAAPTGVYSSYVAVSVSPLLASKNGSITLGPQFGALPKRDLAVLGGTGEMSPPSSPASKVTFATIPMNAGSRKGSFTIQLLAPSNSGRYPIARYGDSASIPWSQVTAPSLTVSIK